MTFKMLISKFPPCSNFTNVVNCVFKLFFIKQLQVYGITLIDCGNWQQISAKFEIFQGLFYANFKHFECAGNNNLFLSP